MRAFRTAMGWLGHVEALAQPPRLRLHALPLAVADHVIDLYRQLGGIQDAPTFAPGGWDLVFNDGLIVELDEELHFHRYRAVTLDAPWANGLPWTDAYRTQTVDGEPRCLRASKGLAGKWTTVPAERMFGPADMPGILGAHGAPRWKQRALYDAMKDAAAASGRVRMSRVSIHDIIDGHPLDDILYGKATVNPEAIGELVRNRTC